MAKIELRRLVGSEKRRGKLVEVSRPVRRVFIDGDFVGMVGEKPGSKFSPATKDLTEGETAAILGVIGKLHG